jgi:iron(III) transport system substrate-binding protein
MPRTRSRLPAALVLAALAAGGARAAAPPPSPVTPALVEQARGEGKAVWYTSLDLQVAESIAKAFEAKYPGLPVQVERGGAERLLQRLAQERASGLRHADVVSSSDAAQFIAWKRDGWLAPYIPDDVVRFRPADKDPDGGFATMRASLSVIGYNTKLVKPEEAPRSYADLLDPRWKGKLVKGHPAYSGTVLTATFQIARDLGWPYFEKLAQQRVMQVQSAVEPPKKVLLGERAVAFESVEYLLLLMKEAGDPVEIVYPAEGTPFVPGPSAVLQDAPHPAAARLFQSYLFTAEAQQLMVDLGGLRSVHPDVREKPGRRPLAEIKLMKDDPAAVEAQLEQIKQAYARYFRG